MLERSEPEIDESEFAYWLEHASLSDPRILDELINRYAVEIIWLLDGLQDFLFLQREAAIDSNQLASTIFHNAWKQMDRFHGHESVRNWLYQQAIKEILKTHEKVRPSRQIRSFEQHDQAKGSFYLPENQMDLVSQIDFSQLSDSERVVFFLRFVVNLKVRGIAEVLGRPLKDVHLLLVGVREKIGLSAPLHSGEFSTEAMHADTPKEMSAQLDGYFLSNERLDETQSNHLFYCSQCNQDLEKLKLLDENFIQVCKKRWPKPEFHLDQIQHIFKLSYQAGKTKSGTNNPPRFKSTIFFGIMFVFIITTGIYLSNQDSDFGVHSLSLKQGSTPTADSGNKVPIRRVQVNGTTASIRDETGNPVEALNLGLNDDTERIYTLIGSDESISANCISMSPVGNLLATCSHIGRVNIWSVEEQKVLLSMKERTMPIADVTFSPDGSLLAAGSQGGTVTLWKTQDGTKLVDLPGKSRGAVFGVSFSPDGKYLAVGAASAAWIWELSSGKYNLFDYFAYPGERVNDVAYSPDGKLVALAVSDGSIWIRRTNNGKVVARLAGGDNELLEVSFSPNNTYLASGSFDGIVNVWQIKQSFLKVPQFSRLIELHHTGWVNDLAFSPDEQLLAVAANNSQLTIWRIPSGMLDANTTDTEFNQPTGVAFSSDGKYLATSAMIAGIHVWKDNH